MDAARAHICHHAGQARSNLLLKVEIPLHHIIALGLGIDKSAAQAIRGKRNIQAAKIRKGSCTSTFPEWVFDHRIREKRYGLSDQQRKLVGQWLYVEQPHSPAECSFSIGKQIPG